MLINNSDLQMILDIIPADRIRLLSEVESQLDETLLKQQLERGCIDVARLSAYLVDLLSRLCAPCREEQLNKIRHAKDLVETLRFVSSYFLLELQERRPLSILELILKFGACCEVIVMFLFTF